eukprot:sb/3468498/
MFVFATLLTGIIELASLLEASVSSGLHTTTSHHTTTPQHYAKTPRRFKPTPDPGCGLAEVGGYLHEKCFFAGVYGYYSYYKCPISDSMYNKVYSWSSLICSNVQFSNLCPSDPGFYQACGHNGCVGYKELGGTPLLCGKYICSRTKYTGNSYTTAGDYWETIDHCKDGTCKNTELNMVGCSSVFNTACDGNCDEYECSDESYCDGVRYGVWCDSNWIPFPSICDGDCDCENGEDEVGCFNWTVADHTTCQKNDHKNPR